jgi:hypothetical protein
MKKRKRRPAKKYHLRALKAWRTKRRRARDREAFEDRMSRAKYFRMVEEERRRYGNYPRAVLDDMLPPIRTIDLLPKVTWP